MNYEILSSSSKANCIIFEKFLVLDCGVTYKKIKDKLKDAKIIFISHRHKDHFNRTTVKQIAYNYPNIKFLCGSDDLVIKLYECHVERKNIYRLKSNKWYDLGLIKVRLEELHHDAPNHLLKWEYKGKKGIYIIDTGNVDRIEAKDYDLYLIEANYKTEILEENKDIKDHNFEYDHLYRVEDTHLSYEQAIDFLVLNAGDNAVYELLHKSEFNFERRD